MPTLARLSALVAAGIAFAAAPARAALLWRGDFSTGDLSQWTKTESRDVKSRLKLTADPEGGAGHALRVLVKHGDEPIGASGHRNELVWRGDDLRDGVDRYYAWRTFWPAGEAEQPGWQIFTQWHHYRGGGSPPLAFLVRRGEIQLGTNKNEVVWSTPLERGRWHDFAFHVRWSSDPSLGLVELWYDGRVAVRRTMATLFPRQGVYLKQGLYRSTRVRADQVVFHRGMRVGTTLDDVWTPPPEPSPVASASGGTASPSSEAAAGSTAANDAASAGLSGEAAKDGAGGGGCASSPVSFAGVAALVVRRWRRRRCVD
jgi:hypothetical protein